MRNPVVTFPAFRKQFFVFFLASWSYAVFAQTSPTPNISGEDIVCPGAEHIYSTPFTQGHTWTWTVSPGGQVIQDGGNSIRVKWLNQSNTKQYVVVQETFSDDEPAKDSLVVFIKNTALVCENSINVSIGYNGLAVVDPETLLDGNYNTYEGFEVSISTQSGVLIGNTLNCSHIGMKLIGKVKDPCTGNSCWSNIKVEDKMAPVFDCPDEPVKVPCNTNLDTYPRPPVVDNCDAFPDVNLSGFLVDNSTVCEGVWVTKTWVAVDNYGNQSTCIQKLSITPDAELDFPDDRIWSCEDYYAFPNITNPSPVTDLLKTTGSGVPIGTLGPYCQYSFLHKDDTLAVCGKAFKIIRTWSVLNWCTGQIILEDEEGDDNEQIIVVMDNKKPLMTVPTITLNATIPGTHPYQCTSVDLLPAPTVSDQCGNVTVQIFTSIGEAVYVNKKDGKQGGYVPSPGLKAGQHIIVYKAIDDCGNVTEQEVLATVTDTKPPTAICDEHTDVNLNLQGYAEVFAQTFDDGSHDNCCIDRFEVKRMGQPDSAFGPSTLFDCKDKEVQVVMRVYDCFGNRNECMVTAFINDKIAPTCIAPPLKVIPCTDVPPDVTQKWLDGFGKPSYYDNCSATVVELPWAENINACGEGHVIRFWTVVDKSGNISGNCEQHIYVTPSSDWRIDFPPNWTGSCTDTVNAAKIKIQNFGCDMWAVSLQDQFFALNNDSACYKIVRTWKVINWCYYDPYKEPVKVPTKETGLSIDETTYKNYGQYEYQQIIKVYDDTPPKLSYPYHDVFCTLDQDCKKGDAFLPIQIDGECSDKFEIAYHIDLNRDKTLDLHGTGFFEGTLPIGKHSILYLVRDGCSNEAQITVPFEVKDCKNPTPLCDVGLVVELMPTGMVPVCARAFDENSYDNCPGALRFSFSEDVTDSCRTFTCLDVLDQKPLKIWVTDAAGNQDYCNTYIVIQDNLFNCDTGIPLDGYISTEANKPVEGVNMQLNGDNGDVNITTDKNGKYNFSGLFPGEDYTITPKKEDQILNGVTTFDLVQISRHILGIQSLDTPYKLIAADANHSESITTFDLVEIRKLILYMNDKFPNNASWRFVDKKYVFPNPANPWKEIFPEVINLNNFGPSMPAGNFVALKTGDVNGSAVTGNNFSGESEERNNDQLLFDMEDANLQPGTVVPVTLRAKDFTSVNGFQFTFDFDTEALDFQGIVPTGITSTENFGTKLTQYGAVTVSWFDATPVSLSEGEAVITLEFLVKSACQSDQAFGISSRFTQAEAYIGETMNTWGIGLNFTTPLAAAATDQAELFQNVPNPFSHQTVIGFRLPSASQATLTLTDVAGRVVKVIRDRYNAGYNEVRLNREELPAEGLLYYHLETPSYSATRAMTLIK
jgi:hypothetical protein